MRADGELEGVDEQTGKGGDRAKQLTSFHFNHHIRWSSKEMH